MTDLLLQIVKGSLKDCFALKKATGAHMHSQHLKKTKKLKPMCCEGLLTSS